MKASKSRSLHYMNQIFYWGGGGNKAEIQLFLNLI